MAYTYEDLAQDLRQAAKLLAGIDQHYDHYKWSVDSLLYEADYLEKHAKLDDEVED